MQTAVIDLGGIRREMPHQLAREAGNPADQCNQPIGKMGVTMIGGTVIGVDDIDIDSVVHRRVPDGAAAAAIHYADVLAMYARDESAPYAFGNRLGCSMGREKLRS